MAEHGLQGGFGAAILEILEEEGLSNVEVKRIGLPDQFIEHGAVRLLRERFGFTTETLLRDVQFFVQGGLPAGGAGTVGVSKGGTAAARGLIR